MNAGNIYTHVKTNKRPPQNCNNDNHNKKPSERVRKSIIVVPLVVIADVDSKSALINEIDYAEKRNGRTLKKGSKSQIKSTNTDFSRTFSEIVLLFFVERKSSPPKNPHINELITKQLLVSFPSARSTKQGSNTTQENTKSMIPMR